MQDRKMCVLLTELGELAAGRNRTSMADRMEGETAFDRTEAPVKFSDWLHGREDPQVVLLQAKISEQKVEISELKLEIAELNLKFSNDPKIQAERQRRELEKMRHISIENAARMRRERAEEDKAREERERNDPAAKAARERHERWEREERAKLDKEDKDGGKPAWK